MWIICSLSAPDNKIRILVGRDYTIGRRDCDITIQNDMSISRKHAVIKAVYSESSISDVNQVPQLLYKDVSKLGTVLRGERITIADSERAVNSGDSLELGTAGLSKYKCEYEPFVVTTSCLDHVGKRTLKMQVFKLGGHVTSEWTSCCNLVVMSNLSVTVKVICALIALKHVVTPQYLTDVVSAVEGGAKLPDPNDYLPPISESQVDPNEVSFKPDARRNSLFTGKKFVFLNPVQYTKLKMAIGLAGGETVMMETMSNLKESSLVDESTCVMWCDTGASQSTQAGGTGLVKQVQQILTRNRRRMITDAEIGFAILHCSTAHYCNPSVTLGANSCVALPLQTQSVPVSSQQISQLPRNNVVAIEKQNQSNTVVPSSPLSVQIKQEPLSQVPVETIDHRSQTGSHKRKASSEAVASKQSTKQSKLDEMFGKKPRERTQDRIPPRMDSVEPSSASMEQLSTSNFECLVDQTLPNAPKPPKPLSDKVKVETTYVADSLATDSCRYIDSATSHIDSTPVNRSACEIFKPPIACGIQSGSVRSSSPLMTARASDAKRENDEFDDSNTSQQAVPTLLVRKVCDDSSFDSGKDGLPSKVEKSSIASVSEGFLSARVPVQTKACDDERESCPSKLVVIEEKNLVIPRQQRTCYVQRTPTNSKNVKNFKVFEKSTLFTGLPRIIGGRDLVAYEGTTAMMRDYFERSSAQEGGSSITDKLSQELFDWQPPKRRR